MSLEKREKLTGTVEKGTVGERKVYGDFNGKIFNRAWIFWKRDQCSKNCVDLRPRKTSISRVSKSDRGMALVVFDMWLSQDVRMFCMCEVCAGWVKVGVAE